MNDHLLLIKYRDGGFEEMTCSRWEFDGNELHIWSFSEQHPQEEDLYFVPLLNVRYVRDQIGN